MTCGNVSSLSFKDLHGPLISLQTKKVNFQLVVNVMRLLMKSCSLVT